MANYKIVSHASAGLPLNVATTTWAIGPVKIYAQNCLQAPAE